VFFPPAPGNRSNKNQKPQAKQSNLNKHLRCVKLAKAAFLLGFVFGPHYVCAVRLEILAFGTLASVSSFQQPASTSDKKTLRSVCLSDQPSLYLAYFAFVLNHNTHIYILVLANLSNPLRCPTNPFFPRRWFICTPLLFLCGSSSAHRRGSMGGWVLDWMVGWLGGCGKGRWVRLTVK